jgi:DNA-binding NtrC family response regulator
MWRTLHSFLSGSPKHASNQQPGDERHRACLLVKHDGDRKVSHIPVIALAVSDHDREVLTSISKQEPWEMHFAESRVEAWDVLNRSGSPVVLYDRDWPNAEWRTTVQSFASSPQRPCVILTSRVADDYLWQELIRCGGHDLLAKPLRVEDVTRALKLALSYWKSARTTAKK